jgi:CubicO group peptidase (beta-lactamase class C family)
MNRKIIILFAVLLQAGIALAQTAAEKADQYLSEIARMQKFNGVVLLAKEGKIILHKGYGWRDAQKRIPHDEHSIFQLGSITKQFTATAILHLQEQGKLNVKDKLSKYIPRFPRGDSITLEHLLTHTSGIFNYTNDPRFMNTEAVKARSVEEMIAVFKDRTPDFSPGTRYKYSNSGYILLGYIIQKVSGKPYEQVVRELIFRPLQMQQSGFDYKSLNHPAKSTGYFVLDSDTVRSSIVDSSVSYAAGSIYSTTGDLYKWHKALYTDKVVKQSSLEQAWKPFRAKYGFGWGIDSVDGKRMISHGGGIFGFTTDMLRVPADDICIILLTNKPDQLGGITSNLLNILYNKPFTMPRQRPEITLPDSTLRQYVGVYELIPTFRITVTLENGQLKAQATGQSKFDLFAQRENFFFLKVVDAQVEFIKDASGKVDKLILHQGGAKQEGKRVE